MLQPERFRRYPGRSDCWIYCSAALRFVVMELRSVSGVCGHGVAVSQRGLWSWSCGQSAGFVLDSLVPPTGNRQPESFRKYDDDDVEVHVLGCRLTH